MRAPKRSTTRAPIARPKASSRFRLGRASRPERARRRWPWRRLAWAAAAAMLVAALALGANWLLLGDALRVRDVHLEGVEVTDPVQVAAVAGVAGESLLTLDTSAVAARVATLPAVRAAEVRREWPHGVTIAVTERQGWGYWEHEGRRVVVDADGRVLQAGRPPAADAPTIVELPSDLAATNGDGAPAATGQPDPDAVRLVRRLIDEGAFSILRVRPTGFVYDTARGLTVDVAEGPDAVLGDSQDYEFKVASWGALLDRIEEQGLAVQEIDLRFGKHVVMR